VATTIRLTGKTVDISAIGSPCQLLFLAIFVHMRINGVISTSKNCCHCCTQQRRFPTRRFKSSRCDIADRIFLHVWPERALSASDRNSFTLTLNSATAISSKRAHYFGDRKPFALVSGYISVRMRINGVISTSGPVRNVVIIVLTDVDFLLRNIFNNDDFSGDFSPLNQHCHLFILL